METPPLLSLRDITKSFGGVHALQHVQLDIYAGEVHAILGENGAGKSTLIKIITGVHQPDSGEILLNGELVSFSGPRDAQTRAIAAIYQEPNLFPDLDIAENIFVGCQPKAGGRVDWRKMYRDAEELLRSLGSTLDVKTKARSLSVAQQQIVEIARALSLRAQIFIMDEPTSSLTLSEVEDLFEIVRRLRDAGTAIIFISHRLEELFVLADRVTTLRDGAYIGSRLIEEVTRDELIHMMVGRNLTSLYPKDAVAIGDVVLEVKHLSLPGQFDDISFELRAGEILGVYGLIGAGRTEIATAIFGVTPALSGEIVVHGKLAHIKKPQHALELGIAYVPEDRKSHGLILPMSIADNITVGILSQFTTNGWINRRAEQTMAGTLAGQLQVKAASLWQRAEELSGGNQQKVVLSKWLATKPTILMLDEPTRGIDVGAKAEVHQLLSTLAAEGVGIIMISSELPEILGMSDRILVIKEGRVAGEFDRAEATQEALMHAVTES
ncbi:MAG: sugar ABC transporter ATP-binding protein [Chloroflexota bacterium]